MTRDMDLIRLLMQRFVQDKPDCPEGYDKLIVAYHVQLLVEAGLIEAQVIKAPSPGKIKPVEWIFQRVTWDGHDFVSHVTEDTVWNRTKDHFRKQSVAWTIDLIMEFLKARARANLGL
jgi:hypothetical protein